MIALLFIAILIPDVYIWYHFLRNISVVWQILWFMPVIVTILLMTLVQTPLYQAWMFRYGLSMILLLSAPKFIYMIFSLIGLVGRYIHPMVWKVSNMCGMVVVAAILCIVCYGVICGWKKLVVHEVTLEFSDLPKGFDGYRIVQLSDLHISIYESEPELLKRIVDTTNDLKPDMICFTGDLVNSSPDELNPFKDDLARLSAPDGVYSIMGNHDYCTYSRHKDPRDIAKAVKRLQDTERSLGWNMMLNEHRIIKHNGDSLMLATVENSSKPPFPDHGNLKKAMTYDGKNTALNGDSLFTILLSHDPTHWRREVLPKSKVQLMLSGHTHGTQFRLFGWSPATFAYDEWGGLYEWFADGHIADNAEETSAESRKLFVSTGTGGNLPFRFGVWPEIVVITLKHSTGHH